MTFFFNCHFKVAVPQSKDGSGSNLRRVQLGQSTQNWEYLWWEMLKIWLVVWNILYFP